MIKRILGFGLIFSVAVGAAYFLVLNKPKAARVLPVYNPTDIGEGLVDSSLREKSHGHTIDTFTLTDQDQQKVTEKTIEGKVFVAEYFFTTCGSICPKMNEQMQRVQKAFKGEGRFKILSFTVDPETDTPGQLKTYAQAHQAIPKQWYFLTGKKEALYDLARKSFFILKPAEAKNLGDANSDFIHTNNFVLVDARRQIRGYYDGTQAKEVDRLIQDIRTLLAEK